MQLVISDHCDNDWLWRHCSENLARENCGFMLFCICHLLLCTSSCKFIDSWFCTKDLLYASRAVHTCMTKVQIAPFVKSPRLPVNTGRGHAFYFCRCSRLWTILHFFCFIHQSIEYPFATKKWMKIDVFAGYFRLGICLEGPTETKTKTLQSTNPCCCQSHSKFMEMLCRRQKFQL